jgi:hypothetical protein
LPATRQQNDMKHFLILGALLITVTAFAPVAEAQDHPGEKR